MTMEHDTVTLPAHWASAIINGDYSGLDPAEAIRCAAVMSTYEREGWGFVGCSENSHYTASYNLYDPGAGVHGGSICDYSILRESKKAPPDATPGLDPGAWMEREARRMVDGTYKPLPISDALMDKLHVPTHFVHLSSLNPSMVAYTKDANMGAKDRQTRVTIETYLARFGGCLNPMEQALIIADIANADNADTVHFAMTPDEIERVYTHYAHECTQVSVSCMRHTATSNDYATDGTHPVRVYGAGDLAIAYLKNKEGKTTARALCWPERKVYSRVYGDDSKLHIALKKLGYEKSPYYDKDPHIKGNKFIGARLLRMYAPGEGFVMPYIDEYIGVDNFTQKNGDRCFVLADPGNSDYGTQETNGTTHEGNQVGNDDDDNDDNDNYYNDGGDDE
jgi:hypothetical protein